MTLQAIVIGGLVGLISGLITTYAGMRLRLHEERAKWTREFALKYAVTRSESPATAESLAAQFGVGILIVARPNQERVKHFIPPGSRFIVGGTDRADIRVREANVSHQHMVFEARSDGVFAIDFSTNGIVVNGQVVLNDSRRLESGDVTSMGETQIIYVAL